MNSPQKPVSGELDIPEGVSSQGMVKNIGDAYAKAIIAIPEMLQGVAELLSNLDQDLNVIAVYYRRKGIEEQLIDIDEMKDVDPKLNEEDAEDENEGD